MSTPPPVTLQAALPTCSPVTASISLPNLLHNLNYTRQLLPPGCEILPIVKADAYGHGAIPIATALAQHGIRRFGVSTVQEGVQLRDAGLQGSIVILGGILDEHIPYLFHYRLTPVISDGELPFKLAERSVDAAPFSVHVKIDTGMRRLGLPADQALTVLQSNPFDRALMLEGIMTHLSDADNADPAFSRDQLRQFQDVLRQLHEVGIRPPFVHAANTAGILFHPSAHGTLVRPGLMLYGYGPTRSAATQRLTPVMQITTKVVHTRMIPAGEPLSYNGIYRTSRPSRIAVIPVGYTHGYSRRLSNTGWVLVGNRRAPVVGRVCMDMTLVDVTETPWVAPGDDVVLLGSQGTEQITAYDLAAWQDTIPYEVLCAMGPRAYRTYESFPVQ